MLANQTQPRGKGLIYHNQRAFLPVTQDGFNARQNGTGEENKELKKSHGSPSQAQEKALNRDPTPFHLKKH